MIQDSEKALRRKRIIHTIMFIILIVVFFCFIFPFILVVINVFKEKSDIIREPLSLIGAKKGFTLANFPEAMVKMNFWTVFGNSLIITVSATILTLLFSSMTAFVIVRNNWKACVLLFSAMIASMVIPFQVLMVPIVSLYGGIFNVMNHRITLILMHVGFSLSMATFMYHGAIHTNIPLELEEAALIDGCTRWQTFWKVVFPLLAPTTATYPGFLRHIFLGPWSDHGSADSGYAADPDPVSLPAEIHC